MMIAPEERARCKFSSKFTGAGCGYGMVGGGRALKLLVDFFISPRGLLAPPRWTPTKLSTRVDKEKEAR